MQIYVLFIIALSSALLCSAEDHSIDSSPFPVTFFCQYNCSGHGTCDTQTGTCTCNPPWNGDACAYRLYPIAFNNVLPVTSVVNEWVYFSMTVPSSINLLQISVVHTNTCYPTLLSRAGALPLLTGYDYGIVGDVSDLSLTLPILNPYQGVWFVGVVSATNCSYTITASISTVCPNNCSGHGHCRQSTGTCDCEEHWSTREDCSAKLQNMQLGEMYYGLVDIGKFIYYKLTLSIGNRVEIALTMTKSNQSSVLVPSLPLLGDISSQIYNLFVGFGYMPDLTIYDYVSRQVFTPPHELVSVIINNPTPGDIYIGIYGNINFEYQLAAHSSYICPNNCNGNGQCTGYGSCVCALFYQREDCSLFIMGPLSLPGSEMPIHDSVLGFYWRFFNTTFSDPKDLVVTLVASNTTLPAFQVYLLPQDLPSTEHYSHLIDCSDEENRISSTRCGASLYRLDPGFWTVGIRLNTSAAEPVKYELKLEVQRGCPNSCSARGTCSNGVCECHEYWFGDDCSVYVQPLPNSIFQRTRGRIITGDPVPWRFYTIDITTENAMLIQVNRTGPVNNGTLQKMHIGMYIKKGAHPTLLSYSRMKSRSTIHGELMQLDLQGNDLTGAGTYHIGIYVHDPVPGDSVGIPVDYWISARWDRICPRNCSKQGACINGQCVCNPPYIPPDCSAQNLPIPTYLELKGKIAFDVWNYYQLTVLGEDALEVIVQEQESIVAGRVWLFLKLNGFPTIDDNDGFNQSTSVMHTVFIPSTKARGNWTIGVTGSPRNSGSNPYNSAAEYTILALTGCGTYSDCGKCVVDPNCGWCRNEPFNPSAGQCVPGTPLQPLNQTCLYYNFNTCDVENSSVATVRGVIIGVVVGCVFLLAISVAIFFVWRNQRKEEKKFMRPVNIDDDNYGDQQQPSGVSPPVPKLNLDPLSTPALAINYSEERSTPRTGTKTNYGSLRQSLLMRNTPEGYSSLGSRNSGMYTDEEDEEYYGEYDSSDSEGEDHLHRRPNPPQRQPGGSFAK